MTQWSYKTHRKYPQAFQKIDAVSTSQLLRGNTKAISNQYLNTTRICAELKNFWFTLTVSQIIHFAKLKCHLRKVDRKSLFTFKSISYYLLCGYIKYQYWMQLFSNEVCYIRHQSTHSYVL